MGLIRAMRQDPGVLARIVAEFGLVLILTAICLSVVFLLVLGCVSLVKVAP